MLEAVALLAGEKPVLRLVLGGSDISNARAVFEGLGLAVELSPWVLRTAYSTSLGDTYTLREHADADDSRDRVVMVAKGAALARRALSAETDDDPNNELGLLFGYPRCCVAAYERISSAHDWLANSLAATALDATCLADANRIATLFSEDWIGFDYFPCSLACRETERIARTVARLGRMAGFDDLIDRAEAAMGAPILLRRGVVLQLREASYVGGTVRCPLAGARLHAWTIDGDADNDPAWDADTVEASEGQIRFLANGRPVATATTTRTSDRLVVFT